MTAPRGPRRIAAAAPLVLLAAIGCGGGDSAAGAAGEEQAVAVKRLAFTPATLSVPTGTTVVWRSQEAIGHTVTSGEVTGVDPATGLRAGERPDGRFDGKLDTTGAEFSHRFADAGTYSYFCSIHDGMNATVVVTP